LYFLGQLHERRRLLTAPREDVFETAASAPARPATCNPVSNKECEAVREGTKNPLYFLLRALHCASAARVPRSSHAQKIVSGSNDSLHLTCQRLSLRLSYTVRFMNCSSFKMCLVCSPFSRSKRETGRRECFFFLFTSLRIPLRISLFVVQGYIFLSHNKRQRGL
jgi:hypothetical protein